MPSMGENVKTDKPPCSCEDPNPCAKKLMESEAAKWLSTSKSLPQSLVT